MTRGWSTGACAVALAATVLISSCGGDAGEQTPASTSAPTADAASAASGDEQSSSTTEPAASTGAPATSPEPDGVLVEIAVVDGSVAGGSERFEIDLGETVTIRVAADVDEEVHVHGYDIFGDVTPSTPAEISFEASIPGVFEVELEKAGLPLARLEIS